MDRNQHVRDAALAAAGSPLLRTADVALSVLLVCAGYYISGIIAIVLRFEPGGISGIWLPHGVLVAALMLTPIRRWWLYAAALLPTHLHLVSTFQGPVPLIIMLIQFAGNIGQAALGAALVRAVVGQPPRLNHLGRMSAFIVGAAFLAGCLVSGVVAWLFAVTDWVGDFWIAWERRVFAQMCGGVILGPLVLDLVMGGVAAVRRARPRRIVEFLVLTVGVIAVMLVFFQLEDTRPHHVWLLFAPLPLLLWSAVRFAPSGLGLHLLAVAVVALMMTKAGRGPFATASVAETVVALQGFILAISIPLMLLAALVQQYAQAAAALRDSRAQYRSVVEDQTELICRLLPDGTYTFVNGAYCRYFGRTAEDLLGHTFWQFLPEAADHGRTRKLLDSLTPDRPVATNEHQVIGPNGDIRWQQWTNRGMFDADGRLTGYQAVGCDVTDRKRAEEKHRLLEAHERVEEALRAADHRKDEFLAMLGHELRNPLAPIGMAAEILRTRAAADETVAWARDVIARQVGHLTRLVDDLLDVSRITRGKINLNFAPLDLRRVITQAIETSRPLLVHRKHDLSIDLPDDPLPVRGDGVRLAQVVSNLLNNAAKYTEAGGRITVSARRDGAQAIIRVVDNGIGIPANMLDRVFELFTQVESPSDRSQGGLGIGLTLVKQLIEMHDGQIEAQSEGPGRGSEFIITLPLAIGQQDEHDAPAPDPAADGKPLMPHEHALNAAKHKRILIVDDNVDAADSLSRMLRLQEHEVLVAYDGPSALTAAARMKPDIVLLDIGLPKMDGLEVARRLRHRSHGAPPLLVATTGFGQAEDRRRIAAAGFDHHLVKPLDPHVLQSLVRTAKPHE